MPLGYYKMILDFLILKEGGWIITIVYSQMLYLRFSVLWGNVIIWIDDNGLFELLIMKLIDLNK